LLCALLLIEAKPRGRIEAERSGGPHSKAFGLLRGKQKARIFVYLVVSFAVLRGVPVKLARRL